MWWREKKLFDLFRDEFGAWWWRRMSQFHHSSIRFELKLLSASLKHKLYARARKSFLKSLWCSAGVKSGFSSSTKLREKKSLLNFPRHCATDVENIYEKWEGTLSSRYFKFSPWAERCNLANRKLRLSVTHKVPWTFFLLLVSKFYLLTKNVQISFWLCNSRE